MRFTDAARDLFTLAWFNRCIYRQRATLEAVLNALTPKELKQELVAKGFLVLRSEPRRLVLASRERENLIMDSGVWLEFDPDAELKAPEARFVIGCVVKSQQSDHRGDDETAGQERARAAASTFIEAGYHETEARSVAVSNPSAPDQILDTWHEVLLAKSGVRLEDLAPETSRALRLPKVAGREN